MTFLHMGHKKLV